MDGALLEGKVIVVVGGTTGLGLAAAKACVASGGRVVVVGRREPSVEAAGGVLGDGARTLAGDATKPGTAERAIEAAIEAFGGFDGLYHVAGGSGRRMGDGPLHEVTDEGADFTLRLNLTALIHSNRAAVRKLLERGRGGSIVNMSSVLAYAPAATFFATHVYAATKAAAIGFTRSCAAYYADRSIRFNVIAPALVATPMSERAQDDRAIMDYIRTKQPLDGGRIGQPDDAAAAAVYFLSDASRFVTGQVLGVDGGWSVSEGQHGGAGHASQ